VTGPSWDDIRSELLALVEEDQRVRAELVAEGSLFDGYHPRMRVVHEANAERLASILNQRGWPGEPRVGSDGANAAWLIVQHAIGRPAFQREALEALGTAWRNGCERSAGAADSAAFRDGGVPRVGAEPGRSLGVGFGQRPLHTIRVEVRRVHRRSGLLPP